MMDIGEVFESYGEELRLVEENLRGLFDSNVFLIPLVGRYLMDGGGKRFRPLFLLSSARLSGYGGEDHISLAGIVESIHTASLLHDDVVDDAELRRGNPPAHSLWGNQVVILVGDFLYSNALKTAVSFKNQDIMDALSGATTMMTEGELLQLEKSGDINIKEEEYTRIAASKTGILISAACRIGAILAGASQERVNALASYGLKTGIAFQMADDMLDYMADEEELGKRLGNDLGEGKITLPLINLIEVATDEEREEVRAIVGNGAEKSGLKRVGELFAAYNVLEETFGKARSLVREAKEELSVFPPSAEREQMFAIADYALKRDS